MRCFRNCALLFRREFFSRVGRDFGDFSNCCRWRMLAFKEALIPLRDLLPFRFAKRVKAICLGPSQKGTGYDFS